MIGRYNNVEIKGIVSSIPLKIEDNEKYIEVLGERRVKKQTRMTGIKSRRINEWEQMTLDLSIEAAEKLIKKIGWKSDDIKVMVMVTQSPSLITPSTAFVAQKYLGLSDDCIVFDVNLGCSGFVSGVHIVAALLQTYGIGAKGVLLAGDVQRNLNDTHGALTVEEIADQMLFGSAASATAIEIVENAQEFLFEEKSDGKQFQVISQKYGQERLMDGEALFEYVINNVTGYVKSFCNKVIIEDTNNIDYYVFHQAQKFILDNIVDICGISDKKMLYSLENYGNTSSASIPLTICLNMEKIKGKTLFLCGFGIGLSCAMMKINFSEKVFLDLIETDKIYSL